MAFGMIEVTRQPLIVVQPRNNDCFKVVAPFLLLNIFVLYKLMASLQRCECEKSRKLAVTKVFTSLLTFFILIYYCCYGNDYRTVPSLLLFSFVIATALIFPFQ